MNHLKPNSILQNPRFSESIRILLATQNWETGRRQPKGAALAWLTVFHKLTGACRQCTQSSVKSL